MNEKDIALEYVLSDGYISYLLETGKWCSHGSNIIEYFDDNDLIYEYSNTLKKKNILKKYISENINIILLDLKEENPNELYRNIYLKKEPEDNLFYGHFWSSNINTNPCTVYKNGFQEYSLTIDFNEKIINWKETLKSRLDYLYGKKEKEYYLNKKIISLKSFSVI